MPNTMIRMQSTRVLLSGSAGFGFYNLSIEVVFTRPEAEHVSINVISRRKVALKALTRRPHHLSAVHPILQYEQIVSPSYQREA